MQDSNTKMHQKRFRLGLCPRPRWGSLQRSPDPVAGFKGPTSKGRRGEGEEERGKEGGEGRWGGARPVCLLVLTILSTGLAYAQMRRTVDHAATDAEFVVWGTW